VRRAKPVLNQEVKVLLAERASIPPPLRVKGRLSRPPLLENWIFSTTRTPILTDRFARSDESLRVVVQVAL
jgi:hypothetical protein